MTVLELDDIDVGILAFLSDVPDSTTTDVAKALFKPPYNISKLDSFVRYRVKRLIGEGVINKVKKGGKMRYSVDEGKVFFGEGVLKMNGVGEVKMGYFVVVKKPDETVAKSIDDYERRTFKKNLS